MKVRRRARMIALQALYEVDSARHAPTQVLEQRLQDRPLPNAGSEFARHLVQGVLAQQAHLDEIVAQIAPEWPVDQIAPIDRNLLRLALFEILEEQTPMKVVINEAVELAKLFGSDGSRRFVNGALGAFVDRREAIERKRTL
jgi:N utilization substance protein B